MVLISKIYEELLRHNNKRQAKSWIDIISKKTSKLAGRYMKRCSLSLIIREMQITWDTTSQPLFSTSQWLLFLKDCDCYNGYYHQNKG
jgi:hypothetical protein